MEDVEKDRACKCGRILPILLLALLFSSNAYTAKQGSLGIRSTGTIGISITIPNRVELFIENNLSNYAADSCLRVFDRSVRPGFNRYQIRMLQGENLTERIEHVMLNNVYGVGESSKPACNELEALFMEEVNSDNANATVLMIVPE